MRELYILSLIILVATLLCLSCSRDREPLARTEFDNSLVAEDFNAVVSGKSSGRISTVYNKFYQGMYVKDAIEVAGIPDSVIRDIKFLRNFNIPKKGYALVYRDANLFSYAIIGPDNDRIVKVVYENTKFNTGFEYTGAKPAASVFDVKKGMTEEEVVALIGKPNKVVDGARDILQYQDPENYFRYIYPIGKNGNNIIGKLVEFEFSKTDRKVIEIYKK